MRGLGLLAVALMLAGTPVVTEARGHGSHSGGSHRHGKIKRSAAAKASFRRSHPCPSTGKTTGACPGYVVDHVRALKHGGSDSPDNMQWQTTAAAKAKDRWE